MNREGVQQPARRGAARVERERAMQRERRTARRLGEQVGAASPLAGRPRQQPPPAPAYEAEVTPGLEEFARAELKRLLGPRLNVRPGAQKGSLCFHTRADARLLAGLGTVAAVYSVHRFPVPRPRAFLGEEHLHTLLGLIRSVIGRHAAGSFRSFRFSAAGVTSAVFARLSQELERRTGLCADPQEGDLLIRVRREPVEGGHGGDLRSADPAFEVLLRLTPRPLSARPWRVCNLPGALSAPVARAMVSLTAPEPHDRFVNLTCGSGTLVVERLEVGPARLVLGGDRDIAVLKCAGQNLDAAGYGRRASLCRWDAGRLPLADASVNALCSDLPYGMLMGSRRENERLYPALLAEAARVAAPGAALVLITQAVALLQAAMEMHHRQWSLERRLVIEVPYRSGILRPEVVLLRRTPYR